MLRQPVVAGQFYSANPDQLRADISRLMHVEQRPERVTGIIAPHAGYVYSGATAGLVYGKIHIPEHVLIIGPNHRGVGRPAALYPDGHWLTPLGKVPVDTRLNEALLQHAPVQADTVAHSFEHSLEVHLPFLQTRRRDLSISALCLGTDHYSVLKQIGKGIAAAIRSVGDEVLIVASSDMTHYESAHSARIKDRIALDRVTALDPEGLLRICHEKNITMCGVAPAAVMLVAAKEMGATRAVEIGYSTSGDVNGDNSQVVGYAAVTIS